MLKIWATLLPKPENLCEVVMTGTHHVKVKNRDAVFTFDLYRNITIVRGDSGTGKTTLYEMIADYTRLKEASGVDLSCDKPCLALTDIDWKNQLKSIKDSIVFIDMVIPLTHQIFASKQGRCGKLACHIAPPLRKGRGLGRPLPRTLNYDYQILVC